MGAERHIGNREEDLMAARKKGSKKGAKKGAKRSTKKRKSSRRK
jgi:hypothetical protein